MFAAKRKKKALIKTDNYFDDLLQCTRWAGTAQESSNVAYWMPTSCVMLNLAILHGIAGGKVTEIYSPPGVGKSALALDVVHNCQQMGGIGIWFDLENALSTTLARDVCRVNLEQGWIYKRPCGAEACLDAMEHVALRAALNPNVPVVMVLDSIPALCIRDHMLDRCSIGDSTQKATGASLLAKWFQRGILHYLHRSNVFVILINQVRSKMEMRRFQSYDLTPAQDQDYNTPGGYGLEHYITTRIKLRQLSIEKDASGRKVAAMISAVITKNRLKPAWDEVHYPFYFRPGPHGVIGIDNGMTMLTYLISRQLLPLGVTKKNTPKAGWYRVPGYAAFDGQDTVEGWRRRIAEDVLLRDLLCQMVTDAYQAESSGEATFDIQEVEGSHVSDDDDE